MSVLQSVSVIYRVDYRPKVVGFVLFSRQPVMEFETEEGAKKVRAAILEAEPGGTVTITKITHEEVEIP